MDDVIEDIKFIELDVEELENNVIKSNATVCMMQSMQLLNL